jgi:hypothetical protein
MLVYFLQNAGRELFLTMAIDTLIQAVIFGVAVSAFKCAFEK